MRTIRVWAAWMRLILIDMKVTPWSILTASHALILMAGPACGDPPPEPRRIVFDVRQQLTVRVPSGTDSLRIWLAMPFTETNQVIKGLRVLTPGPHRRVTDSKGNRQVYAEITPPLRESYVISQSFQLIRTEHRAEPEPEFTRRLDAEERVWLEEELELDLDPKLAPEIRRLADEIVGEEENLALAARRIYDWVLQHADLWVKAPSVLQRSREGSAEHCLRFRSGDSADLHALWIALVRAAGIPARMVHGALLKQELNRSDHDQGTHVWAEFYAPGYGWTPVDVALADLLAEPFALRAENALLVRRTAPGGYRGLQPAMADYYFGHLDARRVVLSRGRNLHLDPPAAGGPVRSLVKAHVEADGAPLREHEFWERVMTYRQRKAF